MPTRKPFTPRRATCGRCGGSGKVYEWNEDATEVVEKTCPLCNGSGVR